MEKPTVERESSLEKLERAKTELIYLLNCCADLPEQFMIGNTMGHTGLDYKFRTSWFQGVFSTSKWVAKFFGDSNLTTDIDILIRKRRVKSSGEKTTREEIDEADQIILRALKHFETLVGDPTKSAE